MWLRKERGGTGIGPYSWPVSGSVCEVPDELGASLLAIPDGGFTKADAPVPAPADSGDGEEKPRGTRKPAAKPAAA